MGVIPFDHIHNGFGVTFAYGSKWANLHFAWVSSLLNFKKRLFSNKHMEVIANNGTNKGASETKLRSHVRIRIRIRKLYCSFEAHCLGSS